MKVFLTILRSFQPAFLVTTRPDKPPEQDSIRVYIPEKSPQHHVTPFMLQELCSCSLIVVAFSRGSAGPILAGSAEMLPCCWDRHGTASMSRRAGGRIRVTARHENVEEGTSIAIGKGSATAMARPGTFSATILQLNSSLVTAVDTCARNLCW